MPIQATTATIQYQLRQTRRSRRLTLSVHPDGRVVISAPIRISRAFVENFVREKAQWIQEKLEKFKRIAVNNPLLLSHGTLAEYKQHKAVALNLVKDRLAYFNQIYKATYKKVTIKRQRTRWGSCSKNGNLNFNYRLVFLPPDAADYVIVHELCHLIEFNHSSKFWALVARAVPNYKELRRKLRGGVY